MEAARSSSLASHPHHDGGGTLLSLASHPHHDGGGTLFTLASHPHHDGGATASLSSSRLASHPHHDGGGKNSFSSSSSQHYPGDGQFMPQFSRDMLLPLLPADAPATSGRLDGHHHDSVVAPIAEDVPNHVVPPARGYDHGQVLTSRGPVNGVLNDTGQQPVRADQESFHALAPRHPVRLTVFDRPSDDPDESRPAHRQDPIFSELDAFRAAQAAEQAAWFGQGFTFTFPDHDPRRHGNAPHEGRPHAPAYFIPQPPGDHRQPANFVSFPTMHRQASAYPGAGVQQQHRQYPHVAVGTGPPGGHDYVQPQGRDGQQHYGPGPVVQQAFPADQSSVQRHGYSPMTPLQPPAPPSHRDPAAMHLDWLQQQYDAERMSATRDPAILDSIMRQMEATRNAMLGIVTPPKTGNTSGQDKQDATPEYKLNGTSALDAPAVNVVTEKFSNEKIRGLGDSFMSSNREVRLMIDTKPEEAMTFLARLSRHLANSVPHGPVLEELLKQTIPLDAADLSAGVVRDIENGRQPPSVTAKRLLDDVDVPSSGGGGADYLADLRRKRHVVSALLDTKDFLMLNKTFTECVLNSCTATLSDQLGTTSGSLQLSVTLLQVLGHNDNAILRQAYGSLLRPMQVPDMGPMSQPQQVIQWMRAAFEARMEFAGRIGMNTAMLSWLMLMQGLPVGKGDMAHVFSEIRALSEGYLSSGEEKSRDAVIAFIDRQLLVPLGQKRWTGSWRNAPQPAGTVAAYAASASPASPQAAARQPELPKPEAPKRICPYWQSLKGCSYDQCDKAHPNGKKRCSKEDAVCLQWNMNAAGCERQPCQYRHPNGKPKKDATTDDGAFNKRDLTPVGQRHTPVDNEAVVRADPTALATHERNRHRRVKYGNPESD